MRVENTTHGAGGGGGVIDGDDNGDNEYMMVVATIALITTSIVTSWKISLFKNTWKASVTLIQKKLHEITDTEPLVFLLLIIT